MCPAWRCGQHTLQQWTELYRPVKRPPQRSVDGLGTIVGGSVGTLANDVQKAKHQAVGYCMGNSLFMLVD